MAECLLNIDLGELPDEDERLYTYAQVANIACGGHAGDEHSMRRALEACARHGTRAGAHPSYEDRAHFGRQELQVAPEVLRAQVAAQCARLMALSTDVGVPVRYAKPHGALYHAANREPALARAVLDGVVESLGSGITFIGPGSGALREAARAAGLDYACEGFADRGTRPDGSLIPRGQPGAVLTDPVVARENALRLALGGTVDTLCVHGDSPGAVEMAREVRGVLDVLSLRTESLGEGALRLVLPERLERRGVLESLKAWPGVVDVVVGEEHACVYFDPAAPPEDPRRVLGRLSVATRALEEPALVTVHVRYDGPDLPLVAERVGLSVDDVALLHASREYTVRTVGFLPGFAYLGEVDARIAVPRLSTPRPRVPALAVGLAGRRTGIYPFASPGGWNLIATAVDFTAFRPDSGAVLKLGDRVRFERVD
ncbi:LamB/YcsF family protein [Vitiosangium sp. GDMCC 1.1324]|uniref:LamB/YcsF family protein n=1 Tax=Vitiosangium sp. (strain GDMCC 1.1324) TaxID=2138576 RepID=UPI000D35E5AE|nr:LamB/YcsF family protein [Vitiosangium sp. GDMCC 1.1324]PTL79548.1 allophanate hydrolase [Vitiosangium sp. GDMCC 1.1324]